ncbi:helix-turn-helix transcriptional regulator [Magnetovibrio sp. PR-2]|uniref:helix-turn-helix domain-containing protein n=1 Tax=Magnetovibrio sp. PR-2 TaxID=3120356 RepID=UPI002FCE30EE
MIATRLKALRRALGISATTLDRKAGFNVGTTGRLERGDQRIYSTHLFEICRLTGLAMEYFFTPSGLNEKPIFTTEHELEQQEFLLNFMRIKDPVVRSELTALIHALVLGK